MRDAVYVVKMSLNVIPEVKEALVTNGAYDIVARVEKKDLEELKRVFKTKIWSLENISTSETIICYT
ncbi:MAG: Lrp/AsnC ligand binding domain-containing protein [Aigarchaeota archaeon]|nr:Lrp/AsnC ligand binding domain-containing protein [Aigarchaeota archaeon]